MSIKMDLSKFKHVKSDKDTTTLQHEAGHTLTLSHKSLSKESREQLGALSKVKPDKDKSDKQPKKEAKKDPKAIKMADGGQVPDLMPQQPEQVRSEMPQQQVPGQEQQQPMAEDPALVRKREIYNMLASAGQAPPTSGGGLGMMDEGADISNMFTKDSAPTTFNPVNWTKAEEMYSQEQANNAGKAAMAQQDITMTNQARTAAGLPPLPVPNIPQGPQVPGSVANPPEPQADQLPQAVTAKADIQQMPASPEGMMQSGFQDKMAGIYGARDAQMQLAQDNQKILAEQVQAQQNAKIAYQKQYDELEKERMAHMEDIKNAHIDPNKYWTGDKDGNGSHSKIASAIGMIIAGFNPTSAPNAAINFLKYQMDQNINAQQQNLNSKQNLLNANLRQFGNLKDATDMTRLMQADIVHNQLLEAANKANTPMAKASALAAAGQLKMEFAPLQQQFAMRRAMVGMANGGDPKAAEQMLAYMRVTNPEMAKSMEARLVPGVGLATIPVPEKAREEIVNHNKLQTAANDLLAFTKKHTTLNPMSADYAVGEQKALQLQSMIREGMLGTVYREGEQPLLDKFVNSNPAGAMKLLQTQPKLKELLRSNESQVNALKQSYGLPVQHEQVSQELVKGKDGRMYRKVPGGYMPVKQPQKSK